jgi:branched-chain amino acid transport system permease protein
MQIPGILRQRKSQLALALILIVVLLIFWKPNVLIYGLQRAGLYAAIAIPMALVLGVVGILNIAHGDFMMMGAYLAYWLSVLYGADPLVAMIPVFVAMFIVGALTYMIMIKHVLDAPEFSQLLLTFGLAMILEQLANLLWTSQPRKLHVEYASLSATIGSFSFGVFEFVNVAIAILILIALMLFLKRTRVGQAAMAVGQNPRGARLVGINVEQAYLLLFSISVAIVSAIGGLFLARHSIFPLVGSSYTMRSFALIAMAGIGNLPGILFCSLGLGVAESFIMSFKGYSGWADIVFFALILFVIVARSYQERLR